MSHLRRVNTPIEKSGKLVPPRKLHTTQWGIMCPSETPEGQSVGVVKNMALGCHITLYNNPEPIIQIIKDNNIRDVSSIKAKDIFDNTRVFVNGDFLGIHENQYYY